MVILMNKMAFFAYKNTNIKNLHDFHVKKATFEIFKFFA
jgi:hypothetical protein